MIDISGRYSAEGENLRFERSRGYPEFNWVDRMLGKEILVGEPGSTVLIRQTLCSTLLVHFFSASGKLKGELELTNANATLRCAKDSLELESFARIQGEGFSGSDRRYLRFEVDADKNLVIDVKVESTSSFLFIPVRNADQFYRAKFRNIMNQ